MTAHHVRRPAIARHRRTAPALVAAALLVVAAASGCSPAPSASPSSVAPSPTPAGTATSPPSATPSTTPTPVPTPVPTPGPVAADPFGTVAPLVGDETFVVYVTDWLRLRGGSLAGAPSDAAGRLALMQSLQPRAPAAGFAIGRFKGHRDAWGWDNLDLAWEARIDGDHPPVFVLGLGPDLDLERVFAHFRDRRFEEEHRGAAVVFSRPLDATEPWTTTTDLAIHHTAVLGDARLMVLSSSPEALDRTLGRLAGAGPAARPRAVAFAAAAAALGEVDAAVVELRTDVCSTLSPRDDPELAAVAATLHPWAALAAGWRTDPEGAATARFAMAYEEPEFASTDLEGRARLARDGSTVGGQPLATAVFRLVDARVVAGAVVLLDVVPAGDEATRIRTAVARRELVFAACE